MCKFRDYYFSEQNSCSSISSSVSSSTGGGGGGGGGGCVVVVVVFPNWPLFQELGKIGPIVPCMNSEVDPEYRP